MKSILKPDADHSHPFVPVQIVSGGQTGVDRGALDAAMALGINHGGWCPAGRLAEDGCVPDVYQMQEHESPSYPDRTQQNVVDSDATLLLYREKLSGGTSLTQRFCRQEHKPYIAIPLDDPVVATKRIRDWLEQVRPEILNVAGPRESNAKGIQHESRALLIALLG